MREIKFRAWDKANKQMLKWEELDTNYTDYEKNYLKSFFEDTSVVFLQYIGLKDKNGKEIYEGDIVRYYYNDDNVEEYETGRVMFGLFESSHEGGYSRCHFHQGYFIVDGTGEEIRDEVEEDIDWSDVEIIGNIYENKELLKT